MKIRCHVRHEDTHSVYYCNLAVGHEGSHMHRSLSGEVYATWGNPEPKPEEHSVLLTLEELKGLVYALSGPEWLEDEPELVAKIDKALKEAL